MKRNKFANRENYELLNEQVGFDFQVIDQKKYWLEDVGYEFTAKEVDAIEKAANDLHQMCFAAVDNVITRNRFKELNIPENMWEYIKKSWKREDWSLYGRFDFCFDGKKLKMLEYNADTPTSLVEAALAQWEWKEGQGLPDQFNSIDEKMVAWWTAYKAEFNPAKVYFTTVKENQEDFRNTEYIMDCATRAGIETDFIFIEDIGSDGEYLYDLENNAIEHMFKLYPWEWLAREEFITAILNDKCRMVEPAWKMILSNKAILAILWELFPNHEYLLPTYFTPEKLGSNFVKKPFLSREGQNIEIIKSDDVESQPGLYKSEFNVYQELCTLPKFDNVFAVIGAWVVGEEACGMGVREDESKITANGSCFAPHYFVETSPVKSAKKEVKEELIYDNPVGKEYLSVSAAVKQMEKDKEKLKQRWGSDEFDERLKAMKKSDGNIFGKGRLEPKSDPIEWGGVLASLFAVLAFCGGIYWLYSSVSRHNAEVDQKNHDIALYNQKQQEALTQTLNPAKKAEAQAWIRANVDANNQEVFNKFVQLHEDLITKGFTSKESFMDIDKDLSMMMFCVQGEKDVENMKTFMDTMAMETETQSQVITYLKKKYNYDQEKITIPSEEDILQFCQFKTFDKDLKQVSQEENMKQTDPKKKVIIEDAQDEE